MMKKLTHFATIGMVTTFLSGYSTAILAENKPALTASSIVEVMNSLDNITNSSYCQNFRIDTEDAESSFGTGHHQASVMLDEPWSNNYSQMFVASSGDFKGSIYSFNAGKGSIDDRFGWLNQDDTLSVDDKVNLSSEKHPSDMAWIRADDNNGNLVDKGILLVAKNEEKIVQFYSFSEAGGQINAVGQFHVSHLSELDVVMTFEREISGEQWVYVIAWNGRATAGNTGNNDGKVYFRKRDEMFNASGDYVSGSWSSGQVNTLDTSDHWKHGQHATIVFVDDEWWVISMEAEAKNNNGAYGFHASKLTFNGNNIMFGVEEHTVYASDAGGVYGADGASNIEALHKSGQLVVTLGGQYADLGEGFNYRTKVKQCHTGLSSPKGAFKVTQRETNRFLDAYTSSTNDFGAVTRTAQQNSSQLWDFTKVSGNIYTIQHQPNDYYLDAWEGSNDSEAVTRFQQGNTTQQWQLVYEYSTNSYQLIQVSSGRYLDAYEDNNDGHDYRAVTRESQNNNSQKWHLSPAPQ